VFESPDAVVAAARRAAADRDWVGLYRCFEPAVIRTMRERIGGGSVSSSLFAGDELTDVTIDGTSARGVLRRGSTDRPLRFKRRRDGWRIASLTAR
jgi:hypothetical protein